MLSSTEVLNPSYLLDGLDEKTIETAQQIAGAHVFNGFEASLHAVSTALSSALSKLV